MEQLNRHRLGLTLGMFAALVHLLLSIFVALGIAEPLVKWSLSMHFLSLGVSFNAFNLGSAVVLVVMAFVMGYIVGHVLAALWNWTGKKSR